MNETHVCSLCKTPRPVGEFSTFFSRKLAITKPYGKCHSCMREYKNKWATDNRARLLPNIKKSFSEWRVRNKLEESVRRKAYEVSMPEEIRQQRKDALEAHVRKSYELIEERRKNGCVDCGEKDVRCLEFDHVRGEKVSSVGHMTRFKHEKLIAEMDKCEVRCANCHKKVTRDRGQHIRPRLTYRKYQSTVSGN